jgi:hypothetical protein
LNLCISIVSSSVLPNIEGLNMARWKINLSISQF